MFRHIMQSRASVLQTHGQQKKFSSHLGSLGVESGQSRQQLKNRGWKEPNKFDATGPLAYLQGPLENRGVL